MDGSSAGVAAGDGPAVELYELYSWNMLHADRWAMPESTDEEYAKKCEALASLWRDFEHCASFYASLVIGERASESKVVACDQSIAGAAGGPKFLCHNILLKFATDFRGIYGGDEAAAAKGASHELRSLRTALAHCRAVGIHVPITCAVNAHGSTVLATALAPVDLANGTTLVAGSRDGGRSCVAPTGATAETVAALGRRLGLARHRAGGVVPADCFLAADVEIHRGFDGRLWLLDAARLLPPTDPRLHVADAAGHLTRRMRPEALVPVPGHPPLCADAFTRMHADSGADRRRAEADLSHATLRVLLVSAPAAAAAADALCGSGGLASVQALLHHAGVNTRFLGLVAGHCRTKAARTTALAEALARTLASWLRGRMRRVAAAQHAPVPLNEPFRDDLWAALRDAFGSGAATASPWRSGLFARQLARKFPGFSAASDLARALQQSRGAGDDDRAARAFVRAFAAASAGGEQRRRAEDVSALRVALGRDMRDVVPLRHILVRVRALCPFDVEEAAWQEILEGPASAARELSWELYQARQRVARATRALRQEWAGAGGDEEKRVFTPPPAPPARDPLSAIAHEADLALGGEGQRGGVARGRSSPTRLSDAETALSEAAATVARLEKELEAVRWEAGGAGSNRLAREAPFAAAELGYPRARVKRMDPLGEAEGFLLLRRAQDTLRGLIGDGVTEDSLVPRRRWFASPHHAMSGSAHIRVRRACAQLSRARASLWAGVAAAAGTRQGAAPSVQARQARWALEARALQLRMALALGVWDSAAVAPQSPSQPVNGPRRASGEAGTASTALADVAHALACDAARMGLWTAPPADWSAGAVANCGSGGGGGHGVPATPMHAFFTSLTRGSSGAEPEWGALRGGGGGGGGGLDCAVALQSGPGAESAAFSLLLRLADETARCVHAVGGDPALQQTRQRVARVGRCSRNGCGALFDRDRPEGCSYHAAFPTAHSTAGWRRSGGGDGGRALGEGGGLAPPPLARHMSATLAEPGPHGSPRMHWPCCGAPVARAGSSGPSALEEGGCERAPHVASAAAASEVKRCLSPPSQPAAADAAPCRALPAEAGHPLRRVVDAAADELLLMFPPPVDTVARVGGGGLGTAQGAGVARAVPGGGEAAGAGIGCGGCHVYWTSIGQRGERPDGNSRHSNSNRHSNSSGSNSSDSNSNREGKRRSKRSSSSGSGSTGDGRSGDTSTALPVGIGYSTSLGTASDAGAAPQPELGGSPDPSEGAESTPSPREPRQRRTLTDAEAHELVSWSRRVFLSRGTPDHLLDAMREHGESQAVQTLCCAAFASSLQEDRTDEMRLRLARAGLAPLLLHAMQRHPGAESLHVYAVAALCRISKVGGEYTARMAADGTVEALQRAGERFTEATVHHHVRLALSRIHGVAIDSSP